MFRTVTPVPFGRTKGMLHSTTISCRFALPEVKRQAVMKFLGSSSFTCVWSEARAN